jgi:hypothetical protein
MTLGSRQRWFAAMLQAGQEAKLIEPTQVTAFVTPEVMAHNLPPEVLGKLLAASLASGAMTPARMLETLSPELLAEFVPLEVLWSCVSAGAERAGISGPEKSA